MRGAGNFIQQDALRCELFSDGRPHTEEVTDLSVGLRLGRCFCRHGRLESGLHPINVKAPQRPDRRQGPLKPPLLSPLDHADLSQPDKIAIFRRQHLFDEPESFV